MLKLIGLSTLALLAPLAACSKPMSQAEQKRRDAADVAAVEAAQKVQPPVKLVSLQPITEADITANNLSGAGCTFSSDADKTKVLALAMAGRAVVKLDRELELLSSDPGGAKLELGAWQHYVGSVHTLTLTPGAGAAAPQAKGDEAKSFAGELTLRDQYDRVVFAARGPLVCGS